MPYYIFTPSKRGLLIKRDRRYSYDIEQEGDFWSVEANNKEQALQKMQGKIRQKEEEEQNKKGSTVSASSAVKTVDKEVQQKTQVIPLKIVQKVESEIQAA